MQLLSCKASKGHVLVYCFQLVTMLFHYFTGIMLNNWINISFHVRITLESRCCLQVRLWSCSSLLQTVLFWLYLVKSMTDEWVKASLHQEMFLKRWPQDVIELDTQSHMILHHSAIALGLIWRECGSVKSLASVFKMNKFRSIAQSIFQRSDNFLNCPSSLKVLWLQRSAEDIDGHKMAAKSWHFYISFTWTSTVSCKGEKKSSNCTVIFTRMENLFNFFLSNNK